MMAEILTETGLNPLRETSEFCHAETGPADAIPSSDSKRPTSILKRLPKGEALFSTLPTEDPDFREIVEEFIPRLHDQLAAMQRALDAQDLPELARLAHWLKGAGGRRDFPLLQGPQNT